MNKTGIVERPSDKYQPFRVWFKGNIIFFAKTKEEAQARLSEAQNRFRR